MGTSVQIDGRGQTVWTGCDSTASGFCNVTMNTNRSIGGQFQGGACGPQPAFDMVSKTSTGGNWVIAYHAIFLTRYAGWNVTVTAACAGGGFTTSSTVQTTATGEISGTILVPTTACSTGTLTVVDTNVGNSAPRQW